MTSRALALYVTMALLCTLAFSASASAQPPATFPSMGWIPSNCGGAVSTDLQSDTTGGDQLDVFGNAMNEAVFYQFDAGYLYLRMRVNANPTQGDAFDAFGWSWAIDVDGDFNPEASVVLIGQGNSDRIDVIDGDGSNGMTDPVTLSPVALVSPTFATASDTTLDLDANTKTEWFIDVAIPRTTLTGFGVTGTFRMWSGSSANFTGIDKDLTCASNSIVVTDSVVGLVPFGCGNSMLDINASVPSLSETCDDGNAVSGDGCSSQCRIEAGYVCDNTPLPSTCTLPDMDMDGVPDAVEAMGDTDGDTFPDVNDPDDDGDMVPTSSECTFSPITGCASSDSDLIPDYLDPDDDNDGVRTIIECGGLPSCADTDTTGGPNHLDTDADDDGLLDGIECPIDTACTGSDTDTIPDFLDADDDGDGTNTVIECPMPVSCIDTDLDGRRDYLDLDSDNDCAADAMDATRTVPEAVVGGHCASGTPVCTVLGSAPLIGSCVECTGAELGACGIAEPACTSSNTCTTCTLDTACARFPTTPACGMDGTCVNCTGTNDDACSPTELCDVTASLCVECLVNTDCDAQLFPECSAGMCVGCTSDAPCSGLTPFCAMTGPLMGACVGCTGDNQCGEPTPLCDTDVGECVDCLSDAQCSGMSPICDSGVCVPCDATHMCSTGLLCALDGRCVTCLGDGDCDNPNPICTVATGTCGPCTSDPQCGGSLVCHLGSGTCVDCNSNAECTSAAPICDVTTHTCEPCDLSTHLCASPLVCDVGTGTCVGCTQNSQCTGGTPICDTGVGMCVPCSAVAVCDAGSVCDLGSGECVACVNDDDCDAPGAGACDGATHTCVQCTGTNAIDCTGSTPLCNTTSHACAACTMNAQCPSGTPFCDTDTGACTADGDPDMDGILTSVEQTIGTDPNDADSDHDGISDAIEVGTNLSMPTNSDMDNLIDALDPDSDDDGLTDVAECSTPASCQDSDGDGRPDYTDADDDQDGIPTAIERRDGTDAGTGDDTDTDGSPNWLDTDADGDGANDTEECSATEQPNCPDANGNGVPDYLEATNLVGGISGGALCSTSTRTDTRPMLVLFLLGLALARRRRMSRPG